MTENQTIQSTGLNGNLDDYGNVIGSDDEECVRECGDAIIDHKAMNRCQDPDEIVSSSPGSRRGSALDEIRSPSPGSRRGSVQEAALPTGKRAPPRQWPPTSPSHQVTGPSKPLVRRGSLKGKVWPPPGYNQSQTAQTSPVPGEKGRKGPPRQWPPPRRTSVTPMSPTIASLTEDKRGNSFNDHPLAPQSPLATQSQNNDSIVQSAAPQTDQACMDISGDPKAQDSYQDLEEDEDFATNKGSHLLSPDSPQACRGSPMNLSPSPPATPEPRSDPSPSPRGSPRENSPMRDSPPRSSRSPSPTLQYENNKS